VTHSPKGEEKRKKRIFELKPAIFSTFRCREELLPGFLFFIPRKFLNLTPSSLFKSSIPPPLSMWRGGVEYSNRKSVDGVRLK
jgi:hypothetical protein